MTLNFDPKNKDWVIGRIKDIISEVLEHGTEAMTLGDLASKQDELAGLNALLGSFVAIGFKEADFAYFDRKIRFANEWNPTKQKMAEKLGFKPTVQDIETEVDKTIQEEIKAELERKNEAAKMKMLWEGTQQVITSWASTIRAKQDYITRGV